MARPPASLPPTPFTQNETSPLSVSLLLGSYDHSPFSLELFDIYIPPSHPAPEHADEKTYYPQAEIQHTFRPDQKVPSKFVSGLAAISVAAGPWIVLVSLVRMIHTAVSLFVAESVSSHLSFRKFQSPCPTLPRLVFSLSHCL